MFAVALAKVTNSLFPIYRSTRVPQGLMMRVAGSAFFVDARGTFASVAHIFDDAPPNTSFEYRGRSPDHTHNPTLPIVEIARDNERDIVIGRVDGLQLSVGLDLEAALAPVGTSVCIAGYPLPRLGQTADGRVDVGNVRRYFQNAMIVDRIRVTAEGASAIRRHEGFMMTEYALFGTSGGPVVTADGMVVGLQASVTKPRVSENAGRKISIENAVAIDAQHVINLLAKVAADTNPVAATA